MQIVIDISEECYNAIKKNGYIYEEEMEDVALSIIGGTPLPKGHGDLIDVGQCDRKLFYQQGGGANSLITLKSAFDMLIALPTIIEADKEVNNDKG